MQKDDPVYLGHMLDLAEKIVANAKELTRAQYDADENLRLALLICYRRWANRHAVFRFPSNAYIRIFLSRRL